MLTNYFKIAFRKLMKFRGYTMLNIFGLSLGLACCLLIVQFLRDELSYDKHHQHKDSIFRVATDFNLGDREIEIGTAPPALTFAIKKDFPEVLESARVFKAPSLEKFLLKVGERSFFEEQGLFADSTFFRMLTYDFVAGDPDHVLDAPFSLVLSMEIANKLFPNQDPLGQSVEIESLWGEDLYTVTGLFNKDTYNTHIDGDFYLSAMSGNVGRRFYRRNEWVGNNLFYTFVQLHPETDPAELETKLPSWLDSYAGDRLREMGFEKKLLLEPLGRIYLHSSRANFIGTSGAIKYIYILGSIALLILLIACINFMNLATAKATARAREIGVRKVVGANRKMLIHQFLSEAFLYTGIAIIFAYIFSQLAVPLFNQVIGRNIEINLLADFTILPLLVFFLLFTTLVVGSYPALYLSSFNPVNILKGSAVGNQLTGKQIRRGLVVLQFIISIALVQGVLVINEQMKYVQRKDLGFEAAHKIIIPMNSPDAMENFEALRNEYLNDSRILKVGGTSTYPGTLNLENMSMYGEGGSQEEGVQTFMNFIEPEYMDLMGFELLEGRLFSRERMADTLNAVVINETQAKGLGYTTETAVGKRMFYNWEDELYSYQIIGVVKDYHSHSLYRPIEGNVFFWDTFNSNTFMIADVQTSEMEELLASMERPWRTLNPDEPFEYYFLEDELQQNYASSQRMGRLIFVATLLAIIISSLGLLGLAAFAAERRTKEIGIRKILGASFGNIIGMLSKDFLGLVTLGFIIASPLTWYAMNRWLENFHFHVSMPWWAFLLGGLLALLIALLTVGWQSWHTAKSDPVRALRVE